MKFLKFLIFAMLLSSNVLSMVYAATPNEQQNIQIVQSLDLGKTYPYPSSFGLSDIKTSTYNVRSTLISCNDDKIFITQSALGKIIDIVIRDPLRTLYGMEIGKTKWNDEIVQNKYFLRQEISPNGKTIQRYYLSEADKNVLYIAVFTSPSYKISPVFAQFEKKYIE